MKKLLLNLPDAPRADRVVEEEGFQPRNSAWLNTVWQNWCTYGPGYPQKNTIVFTTLSREDLPNRDCTNHCKCPLNRATGEHKVKVDGRGDPYERSAWPIEFVGAVLRACVGEPPYAGL
jgi:hypothetical protein